MPTFRGFTYKESSPDSPEEYVSLEEARANFSLLIPWQDRVGFGMELVGYATEHHLELDPNLFRWLSRHVPYKHPAYSGPSALWGHSVSLKPDRAPRGQDGSGVAFFEEAKMTLTCATRKYQILTDDEIIARAQTIPVELRGPYFMTTPDEATLTRYVSMRLTPKTVFQNIAHGMVLRRNGLIGAATSAPVASNLAVKLLFQGTLEIIWHGIPLASVPYNTISRLHGKCNAHPIGIISPFLTSLVGGGIGPGRLVFQGAMRDKEYRQADGAWACDLVYRFLYVPYGANRMFLNVPTVFGPAFYDVSFDGASSIDLTTGVVTGDPNKMLAPPAQFLPNFLDLFRPDRTYPT